MSLVVLAAPAVPLMAQSPADRELDARDLPGIVVTPEIAHAVASSYVRGLFKSRYDLPDEYVERAQEAVARRLMAFAHDTDGPLQELVQRYFEEQFSYLGENAPRQLVPPKFGKEMGERMLPLMPKVRELVRNVGQDIRPMLPMKQQLKLAGDLMTVSTAIDGFEATMRLWADGQARTFDNPFQTPASPADQHKDAKLDTEELERARREADQIIREGSAKHWRHYLDQFKALYELDPAQVATAESVLREFIEREQRMNQAPAAFSRLRFDYVWMQAAWQLFGWEHPLGRLAYDHWTLLRVPTRDLSVQFKRRLESIPTGGQRRRADEKVNAFLESKGLLGPETHP